MTRLKTLTLILCTLSILLVPTISVFDTNQCTGTNQFFDSTLLACDECPDGSSPTTNRLSCICDWHYASPNILNGGWEGTCSVCGANQAPSADLQRCVNCPSTYNSATGDCTCPDDTYIAIDINPTTGEFLLTKSCVQCDADAFPAPYGTGLRKTRCERCENGRVFSPTSAVDPSPCKCDTGYRVAGDTCILATDLFFFSGTAFVNVDIAKLISFNDFERTGENPGNNQISGTIEYLYYKAITGCIRYQDPLQCQAFANLCVLVARRDHPICSQFETASSNADTTRNIPTLFYYGATPTQIINDVAYQTRVTLGKGGSGETSELDLYLVRYHLNGTYLGTVPLTNEVLICPNSVAAAEALKSFGISFKTTCNLDLSLFTTADTTFYEIYFRDSNGDMDDVPIPVKIMGYRTSTNTQSNVGSGVNTGTVFVKRFTIFDTVSFLGSTTAYLNREVPTVIRFAKTIRLVVSVQDNDNSKIKRPYLEITYASRLVSGFATNSTTWATFQSEYKMDISGFWKTATILFIIANIIVGIVGFFKVYIWARYNPSRFNPENWILVIIARWIIIMMKHWSEGMFFFLFIMSGYWFIFYKMQNSVHFLVPDPTTESDEYRPFYVVFILMVIFQFLAILNMIREQVQMDFFFIDWEKPRLTYKRELNREVYFQSAWRMILVANEFNELQVERHFKVELLYLIYGFFMIGLKWERLAAIIPTMTTSVLEGIPTSPILKFFLGIFLLFIISIILYGLRKLIILRFPTPIQEFTDLCSIANVSLMVFDKEFHGYYLHGMSPSGSSEGSIGELKRALELESKGTVRGRGLLANDPTNLQTYEIFFPCEVRQAYNNLYKSEITKELYARQAAQAMNNQVGINLKVANKAMPNDFDYAKLEGKRLLVQEHLKLYIEGVRVESAKLIREKTPSMRFFGIPPVDYETFTGNPLFFRDANYGFQNTLFFGNEFTLIIMDIIIYLMWDMILKNTMIALFLSYLVHKFISWIRVFFGERNIAQKALIDDAFLI